MTRAEIMAIAKRKGEFRVHRYRWRDSKARRMCRRLANEGRLRLVMIEGKEFVFMPQEQTP